MDACVTDTSSTMLERAPLSADPLFSTVVRQRSVRRKRDILRQGEATQVAHILLEGQAYRYRLLPNGGRQITAILMPGDLCDLDAMMIGRADYGVATLTACRLGEVPAEQIQDLGNMDPGIARALWRRSMRDGAIARQWLVNIGRRPGLQRLAHLFCELRVRLHAVGLANEDGYPVWLTQIDLADVLGLTHVHVSRVLQTMRASQIIRLEDGRLTILDDHALEEIAGFDPGYLA